MQIQQIEKTITFLAMLTTTWTWFFIFHWFRII